MKGVVMTVIGNIFKRRKGGNLILLSDTYFKLHKLQNRSKP